MFPSPSSMAPTMSILPSWLRPCPPVGGSSLVRNGRLASSMSTRPDNGLRSGSTMLARSLWASSQALRQEPIASCFWSCRAEMPLEWVAIRSAAQNQTVSGSLLACRIVPAITEVCRRQPVQAKVCAFLRSAHPFSWPHLGQTKPSGQRISISQAARRRHRPGPCAGRRGGCRGPVSCGGSVGRNVLGAFHPL